MKNRLFSMSILAVSVLAASLLISAPTAKAQTNSPGTPPTAQSFPGQVMDYFTSFNTNLDTTFADNRFDLWTGASSVQGAEIPLQNELGLSYELFKSAPSTNNGTITFLGAEAVTRTGGVAGTLVSQQGGFQAGVIVHDVKLAGYADGGLEAVGQNAHKGFAEIGLRVFKALGSHTYAGVGAGARFPQPEQVFSAYVGATF